MLCVVVTSSTRRMFIPRTAGEARNAWETFFARSNAVSFVCDLVKDYADRLYGYDPSDRLFEVTKHYLKHEMERGCKKTGLREIRVHDLRHSHASLLIELGFAPLLISERLGHESVTTTLEIYSHLYPTKHGEVADRLEAFA